MRKSQAKEFMSLLQHYPGVRPELLPGPGGGWMVVVHCGAVDLRIDGALPARDLQRQLIEATALALEGVKDAQ